MKVWAQEDENLRGWWAAAGRIRRWKFERPLWLSRKDKTLSLGIGVAGFLISWGMGIYISFGVTHVGFVGVGWHPGYGPKKKDWARHEELKAKVLP